MDRFTIERTLCTTTLGATYECRFQSYPSACCRAPRVLKASSLATHRQLLATLDDATVQALDDPLRERAIVARLIASGGHDHVVKCYDQFVSTDLTTGDECVCVVMEYCDDGDLCALVTATPHGVGERQAIRLMLQVVRGVVFLQSRLGLAHRDLSLENVFLRDGVCKLADFGLATPCDEKAFGRVGKLPYMAPEVVASPADGYDPAPADVWSLGIMLFILLTGAPLVDVASRKDRRFVVLTSRGVGAILQLWGFDISQSLVTLLDTMLREQAAERPPLTHVLDQLTRLHGEPIE